MIPHFLNGQCAVAIEDVQKTTCYYTNNQSNTTVTIIVSWTNAVSSGSTITVDLAGQSRTITTGSISVSVPDDSGASSTIEITSPQVVAFDLNADGSSQTVSVSYSGCSEDQPLSLPTACPPLDCNNSDIGGVVFSDFNANGIKETSETIGTPNVTVSGFACDGTIFTTTTDAFGEYTLDIPSDKFPIRVEFSNLPTILGQGTIHGSSNGTTVQFVTESTCDLDLGVLNKEYFCHDLPPIFVPCYINGSLSNSEVGPLDAIVGFPYDISGQKNPSAMVTIATAAEVGSTWSLSYDEINQKLYSGAVLRRHAALGPKGLGGIYLSDLSNYPTSVNTTGFLDVSNDLGIDVGSVGTNASRGIVGGPNDPNNDPLAFVNIGKVGIGGMDLSSDGNTLYFMNVFDNTLYSIDLTNYNINGILPTSTEVQSFPLSQSCTGGNLRGWAVKVNGSNVYVGAVCDGSISGNTSDLKAFIFEINPNAASPVFSTIMEFPLNYPKGFSLFSFRSITGWYTWSDIWNDKIAGNNFGGTSSPIDIIHPEPILAAIEFDIDGSIIIALDDRTGFQSGVANYGPTGTTSLYDGFVAGDILRGYSNNGNFVLENNAKAGPAQSTQVDNNQGPGFGEFYNDNSFVFIPSGGGVFNLLAHAENVMGGLALRPGSGEVLAAVLDPLDLDIVGGLAESETFFAGGVRHWNNDTGNTNSAYIVYATREENAGGNPVSPGSFSKAAGLGDLEIGCSVPTYLEVGNYIWSDDNANGIQDPCEQPIPDVLISLYDDLDGSFVASTTTNNNGEYYFTDTSGLEPNKNYIIIIGYDGNNASSQFSRAEGVDVGDNLYHLTIGNIGTGANPTYNDSNADSTEFSITKGAIPADYPYTSITTGNLGSVNHTIDFGLIPCPELLASSIDPSLCGLEDGSINLTLSNVPDGTYTINYEDVDNNMQAFANVVVSNGTATITNLGDGVYNNLSITHNGCSSETNVPLNISLVDPALPTLAATGTNPSSCGGANGSIAFTLTSIPDGIYTINYLDENNDSQSFENVSIENGSTSVLNLGGGVFNDLSVSLNGCTSAENIDIVLVDPTPTLAATSSNPSLCGLTDGLISFTLMNVPNGNYDIGYEDENLTASTMNVNVNNGNAQVNLGAGTFNNLSISFAGCTSLEDIDIEIIDPASPTITLTNSINPSYCHLLDGSLLFTFTGIPDGNYEIDYEDENGGSQTFPNVNITNEEALISNLGAGNYQQLRITLYGCTSNSLDIELTEICNYDFGDLPDLDASTGIGNYQTDTMHNGPAHLIIPGLYLGSSVDFETNGFGTLAADGDDNTDVDDEDGLLFPTTMKIIPEGTLKIPLFVTNTTIDTAFIKLWIDWNGDGDFEETNELIADLNDGNGTITFPDFILVNIPDEPSLDQNIGVRIRLSNDGNITPYGVLESGEVEDYLIQIKCKEACLKISSLIKNNN